MEITYRKAEVRDLKDLRALIALYPNQLMQDYIPPINTFFLALHNNTLVGCCAIDVYNHRIAEIRSLAVRSEYHGQGIATELIKMCVDRAKERGIKEIITITGRMGLFSKAGFKTFNNEKTALFLYLD